MIRAALLTLVATTSAGHAPAAPGREVVNIDDDPGHSLVIVRSNGDWRSGGATVLAYTDATGACVQVYADHPVSCVQVDERLRQAEREDGQARAEGRREAAQARNEAAKGRIEAQHDVQQARAGALADAD